MSYLCQAERQVLAKAYASSLDLNLNATSSGIQVCRTSKPWLRVSSMVGCQQNQHGFFACVYQNRMTTKQLSTDSVNEEKKCLVESGKVTPTLPPRYQNGINDRSRRRKRLFALARTIVRVGTNPEVLKMSDFGSGLRAAWLGLGWGTVLHKHSRPYVAAYQCVNTKSGYGGTVFIRYPISI